MKRPCLLTRHRSWRNWYWCFRESIDTLRARPRCVVGLHYGGTIARYYGYYEPTEYVFGCVECEDDDWQPLRWRVMERIFETDIMQDYIARMYPPDDDGNAERIGWPRFLRTLLRDRLSA